MAEPSTRPSGLPLADATSVPLDSPSRKPSAGPAGQPTSHPSTLPSDQPTADPAAGPTSQPTRSPYSQPSARPSRWPTSQPSASPSNVPTAQPSQNPASHPSSNPSRNPSAHPSLLPSSGPSTQPTSDPTSRPTQKPSSQPADTPSSVPSSTPTDSPSNLPTSYPSRRPSRQPHTHPSSLPSKQPSRQPSTQPVAEPTAQPHLRPSLHPSSQPSAHPRASPTVKPTSLPTATPTSLPTHRHTSYPSSKPSGHPQQRATATPTIAPTNMHSSLINIIRVTPSLKSLVATVLLYQDGFVQCMASPSGPPVTMQHITALGSLVRSLNRVAVVSITSLVPATNYSVYCSASTLLGQQSSLAEVLALRTNAITLCCKLVSARLTLSSAYEGQTVRAALMLSIDAPPAPETAFLTLSVATSMIAENGSHSLASMNAFSPSSLQVNIASNLQQAMALLPNLPVGRYAVQVLLGGHAASEYELTTTGNHGKAMILEISSADSPPATPKLLSAEFASDGASIAVSFDSATNGISLFGQGMFNCAALLLLSPATYSLESSLCQWSVDADRLTLFMTSSATIAVGDSLKLLPRSLKAACPAPSTSTSSVSSTQSCSNWSYVSPDIVLIRAPANPTTPRVIISLPANLGGCDSCALDLTLSTGSGGRPWTKVSFAVDSLAPASTVVVLKAFLDKNFSFSPPPVIPRSMLLPGYVRLCD